MTTVALIGAGGKIGYRTAERLKDAAYHSLYVEVRPAAIEALARLGLTVTPRDEALPQSDVVILAVPDVLIGQIAHEVVPRLKPGAMVMCLDAAAPAAGVLPVRPDIAYFAVHPCHAPIPSEENDPEARLDFFGGVRARQHIVCALMQGTESDYATGEALSRVMFAPVMKAHRITAQQMALLEPILVETVGVTCVEVIAEALHEVVRMGVPEEAARDFLLGHLNVTIAQLFGFVAPHFSDGCLVAMKRGRKALFQPNWKDVLTPDNVMAEIQAILQGARAEEDA
jgi:D-apionate oxidoisomerase